MTLAKWSNPVVMELSRTDQMKQAQVDTRRRVFLTAAACAPAIAVGALLTRQKSLDNVVVPAATETPAGTGYHETEHIRQYYRSAAYY
jgi:hypothetical protein